MTTLEADRTKTRRIQTFPTPGGGKYYFIPASELTPAEQAFAGKIQSLPAGVLMRGSVIGVGDFLTNPKINGLKTAGLALSTDLLIEVILAGNLAEKGSTWALGIGEIKTYISAFGDLARPWLQAETASIADFAMWGENACRQNARENKKICAEISPLFAAVKRAQAGGGSADVLEYFLSDLAANPNQELDLEAQADGLKADYWPTRSCSLKYDLPLLYCLWLAQDRWRPNDEQTLPVTQLMLQNGADPNKSNSQGLTPYSVALQRESDAIVREFRKYAPPVLANGVESLKWTLNTAPLWAVKFLYEEGVIQTPEEREAAIKITEQRALARRGLADFRVAAFCINQQPLPGKGHRLARLGGMAVAVREARARV